MEKSIGFWRATSLVLSNVVGAGILMVLARMGKFGTVGLLAWILTSIGAVCLALVFANLSRKFPKTGGPYAYSREVFGDFVGFQMAWCYWVGTWASNAALAIAFVSHLKYFFPIMETNPFIALLTGLSIIWGLTFVNTAGVKQAASFQVILTVLKILPLAIIGIFGSSYIGLNDFTPLNPSGLPFMTALGAAAIITLFTYIGIESATIPAGDVSNPEKTIPRATIVGTLMAAGVYIWMMLVIMGIMTPEQMTASSSPLADAAQVIFGSWMANVIAVVALISIFGTLNGWILLQGQVPLAAANDELFPKIFAKVSKNGTPVFGLVISSILMSIMLYVKYETSLVDQFEAIAVFSSFAFLLPYLYSAVANIYCVLKDAGDKRSFQFIKSMVVSVLGFLFCLLMIAGTKQDEVYIGTIFVFAGVPIYVFIKKAIK